MPEISKAQLWKELTAGTFAPVYVLFGPETHLRDVALKHIVGSAFGDNDLRDFNETEASMNGAELRDILGVAEQLPMMSQRRVVTIRDVTIAATASRDTLKETDEAVLSQYLLRPSPTSIVIFVADELNGNRKLAKILKTGAVTVEFAKLDEAGLLKTAKRFVDEKGAEIDQRTLQLLVNTVGDSTQRLLNEVSKLAAAALPEKRITAELIESLVGNSRLIENFALTGSLLSGDRPLAMRTMKKILDDGAEPLMILGLIGTNLRKIMMAKDLMESGANETSVYNAIKVRYNDRSAFLAAARRTSVAKLSRSIQRIAETDVAIKTSISGGGPQGSRMQIEMLVCELALLN